MNLKRFLWRAARPLRLLSLSLVLLLSMGLAACSQLTRAQGAKPTPTPTFGVFFPTVVPFPTMAAFPTATATPMPIAQPTAQPTPTQTRQPTATPVPTVQPTATPTATVQATATATPVPTSLVPVGPTGTWNLLFHDEFSGSALDRSRWNTCFFNFHVPNTNDCTHDQHELELYQPGNVSVSNGVLTLRAEKQDVNVNGQQYHYTSGMISTGPATDGGPAKFSFQYGYMEMRAWIPAGQGLWPAFWTLASDESYPPEIDVFEFRGNATNVAYLNYHWPNGSNEGADEGSSWEGPNFAAGWHTFGVDWEPGSLTWYIDGVPRFKATGHITTKPQYLLANLAVGGDFAGNPHASIPLAKLQIDYIRVWQR